MGGIPVPALCPNQDSVCTHSSSEMWCGSVVVASTLLPCSFCQLQDPPRPWEIPCNQASQCPGLSKETLSHLGAKEPRLGMDPTEGAGNTGSCGALELFIVAVLWVHSSCLEHVGDALPSREEHLLKAHGNCVVRGVEPGEGSGSGGRVTDKRSVGRSGSHRIKSAREGWPGSEELPLWAPISPHFT